MTLDSTTISWRTIEKLLAYGAGIVGATNGFAQVAMPTTLRDLLVAAAAFVVHALHVSGPAATANTSTSPKPAVKAADTSRTN